MTIGEVRLLFKGSSGQGLKNRITQEYLTDLLVEGLSGFLGFSDFLVATACSRNDLFDLLEAFVVRYFEKLSVWDFLANIV